MNRRRRGVNYTVTEVEAPIGIEIGVLLLKVIGISENIIGIFNYFSIISCISFTKIKK